MEYKKGNDWITKVFRVQVITYMLRDSGAGKGITEQKHHKGPYRPQKDYSKT